MGRGGVAGNALAVGAAPHAGGAERVLDRKRRSGALPTRAARRNVRVGKIARRRATNVRGAGQFCPPYAPPVARMEQQRNAGTAFPDFIRAARRDS
jgi:hypothetical protein